MTRLVAELRERVRVLRSDHRNMDADLMEAAIALITAQQHTIELQGNEVRSLEARVATLTAEVMHYTAGTSHPPVTVRGEPMACPCGKCP